MRGSHLLSQHGSVWEFIPSYTLYPVQLTHFAPPSAPTPGRQGRLRRCAVPPPPVWDAEPLWCGGSQSAWRSAPPSAPPGGAPPPLPPVAREASDESAAVEWWRTGGGQ